MLLTLLKECNSLISSFSQINISNDSDPNMFKTILESNE